MRKPSPDFDGPPPVTFRPDALEFLQALPWRDDVWELGSLVRQGGNQSKAARLLGVHRNTLLRRIRKLGIHIAT